MKKIIFFKNLNQVFSKDPAKDRVLSKKEFQQSIQEYYKIRGWDQNGIPTEKKLKKLDLDSYKI